MGCGVVGFCGSCLRLLGLIRDLFFSDPLVHVYLFYDIAYEVGRVDVWFKVCGNSIRAYLLTWKGPSVCGIHIWGDGEDLIKYLKPCNRSVIHLYSEGLIEPVMSKLSSEGFKCELKYFYTMEVNESNFKPFKPELARRLGIGDLSQFLKIKEVQGRPVSTDVANELLSKLRYYGVFVDSELVSFACAYLRTPEIWVVGDVFTHPDYRGRGFGKVVASAITRDAVLSGAKSILHVEVGNEVAIRLYEKLGYVIKRKYPWIFVSKG